MERTVPSTASDEIDLYLRTLYSLLRSTAEVQVRTLEEVHASMNSLLHPEARKETPDMSAFIYSVLRLPDCMPEVRSVVLGQSLEVFSQHGFNLRDGWQVVSARARRRRCFYNEHGTLACMIASRSDIDDLVPTLVAYQLEWNKMHTMLQRRLPDFKLLEEVDDPARANQLAEVLQITRDDLERLRAVWGKDFSSFLNQVAKVHYSAGIRLLSGSLSDYRRATHAWWTNLASACPDISGRPVYFISSNMHSLSNLMSGFALQHQSEIIQHIEASGDQELLLEWEDICSRPGHVGRENFLYYTLKKVQQDAINPILLEEQQRVENQMGIYRIPSEHYFDVDAQVIEIGALEGHRLDPRLQVRDNQALVQSNAVIINIDYPLGLAAYNILSKVAEEVSPVLGVYVMGKAATLNSTIGDIMIPNVVHDEHSHNTYLFQNVFLAADLQPFLKFGTVLDNQKAVTVAGTFLQNASYMDVFYREGYTDIEMEAGAYLSAVFEMYRPTRHPINEIVNLYGVPFDIGILHYASDTPLSKGKNLGAGTLSYFGMDSTYAASVAILRRIFHVESRRLGG
jgi:hypothetical protein